jgi:uncharacterized protein (DUF433 family)
MGATLHIDTSYIVKTPGILGGESRIEGHRISVAFIVDAHIYEGVPVDEIARLYQLSPAQIHAALSYYYDHRQEIEAILAEEDQIESENINPARQADLQARAKALVQRHKENDPNREMTAAEIAQEFGITARAVRKAAMNGSIPARKSGATWLVKRGDAVARWGGRMS